MLSAGLKLIASQKCSGVSYVSTSLSIRTVLCTNSVRQQEVRTESLNCCMAGFDSSISYWTSLTEMPWSFDVKIIFVPLLKTYFTCTAKYCYGLVIKTTPLYRSVSTLWLLWFLSSLQKGIYNNLPEPVYIWIGHTNALQCFVFELRFQEHSTAVH